MGHLIKALLAQPNSGTACPNQESLPHRGVRPTLPRRIGCDWFTPVDDEAFGVVAEIYDYDVDWPLDPVRIEHWQTENARFEQIVLTTSTRERIPGDLALPLESEGPFPCALLLHGLGNDRDRWWASDREKLPQHLLANGIAVFTIDLCYHGQRAAENDYQSPMYLTFENTLFVRSRNMIIQSALEELAATVACAVPSGPQPATIDPFNFAPRTQTPILLLIGRSDWMSSPADAKMLLELMPIQDHKLEFYDSGHRLPPAFSEDAADWIIPRVRNATR